MLHVHRDMNVSRENILRRFDETGHRKIGTHMPNIEAKVVMHVTQRLLERNSEIFKPR
jgi:hypothetical protein